MRLCVSCGGDGEGLPFTSALGRSCGGMVEARFKGTFFSFLINLMDTSANIPDVGLTASAYTSRTQGAQVYEQNYLMCSARRAFFNQSCV